MTCLLAIGSSFASAGTTRFPKSAWRVDASECERQRTSRCTRNRPHRGDPAAQYELARWTENHCERLGSIILWPCQPDVLSRFAWLEKAAAQDYPPAVYLVGVRLMHGEHIPKPPDWTGPAGNHFPQP